MDATIPVVYLRRSKFCVAFSPFSHFFLPFLFFFHSFILFDPIRLFPSRDRYRSSDVDTRADEFLIERVHPRVQINRFLFFIGQTLSISRSLLNLSNSLTRFFSHIHSFLCTVQILGILSERLNNYIRYNHSRCKCVRERQRSYSEVYNII